MEKLLDIPKMKFGDDGDYKFYRFQCDCLSAEDAMDISVESCGKDDKGKFITLTLNFIGTGFLSRIKYAFSILRGHWTWREFIVREEDFGNLSDIFNPKKDYSKLP